MESKEGKLELQLRVLGNELIAIKMEVDDFKLKWLIMGLLAIVSMGWAVSEFAPAIVSIFGGN